MKHTVYVDGQDGTTGLRIHDHLAARDDLEVLRIDPERRKDPAERARLLNAADVAFLCLPDAAAVEAVALVDNPSTCLIDASTAHRTDAAWVYGLPELSSSQRDRVRSSRRIANPGCHATAFVLLLRPLVDAGLVSPAEMVSATSITGYSGGGKSMIAAYEADEAAGGRGVLRAPRPYALGLDHKHLPEMAAHTGLRHAPIFMPIVGPFYQGLTVSVPLPALNRQAEDVWAALSARYEGEPFVHVRALNDAAVLGAGPFDVQACNGTNDVDLFVFANDDRLLLMARLDNLGKGASGAAVQSMNLHLGLDERVGLAASAAAPVA